MTLLIRPPDRLVPLANRENHRMLPRSDRFVLIRRLLMILAVLTVASGCGNQDKIVTYEVPKEIQDPSEAPIEISTTPTPDEPKQRFLAYLIKTPDGQAFWTALFKAPTPVVNQLEPDFETFISSIRWPKADDGTDPTWTVPPAWRVVQPSRDAAGFRIVTLHRGPKRSPVEFYLSRPTGGELLDNVNRWRTSSIGLPPIEAKDLKLLLVEKTINGKAMYRIDMRGPGVKDGGRMPPFAGK